MLQMCSGSITSPAMLSRLVYWAVGKSTVTVFPEAAHARYVEAVKLMAVFFFTRLIREGYVRGLSTACRRST